ncbi:MAG: hypothetical protein J2P17_00175 [Mycobacterium sp.]|nr:hypothetical protein [Mycobacterium sp.]
MKDRPVASPSSPDLPSSLALFSVLQGRGGMDSPVADSAGRLSNLFRELIARPHAAVEIRAAVGLIVTEVDRWVAGMCPRPRPGATLVMESFGGALSRVVEAWEVARWARETLPADHDLVHRSWTHLAEMKLAYQQFHGQILTGEVELPRSWPGIETIRQ